MNTLSEADRELLKHLINKNIHKTIMTRGRCAEQYQKDALPLPVYLSRRAGLNERIRHLAQLKSKLELE